MTSVVNIRHVKNYDVYIGRSGKGLDGYFGNSHPVYDKKKSWTFCMICNIKHTREEALEAYKKTFNIRIARDKEFKKRILELRGKCLGCFCHPLPCHGDIIVNYLNNVVS